MKGELEMSFDNEEYIRVLNTVRDVLPEGYIIEERGTGMAIVDPRGFYTYLPKNQTDCKRMNLAISVYHMTRLAGRSRDDDRYEDEKSHD